MYISYIYRPFLDDIAIKGPKTRYNDKEVELGLRRYVVKYIKNLDEVLYDLERANITIYGLKL